MGGYRAEYKENLDEYEDDEADGERYEGYEDEYEEGYEEEEEEPQPPKEVQDYLVLRQRLKEEKRKQLKKELGTANASSRDKKNSFLKSNDNYGSFFGSLQPVLAPRVIQESKSLLENPHLLDKATKSKNMVTKSAVPDSVNSKSQATGQTPKVVNQVHKKVQIIKKTKIILFYSLMTIYIHTHTLNEKTGIGKNASKLEEEATILDASGEAEFAEYDKLKLEIDDLEKKIMAEIMRPEIIAFFLFVHLINSFKCLGSYFQKIFKIASGKA